MFRIGLKMTKIDPKMLKIRQIYPELSKKCINYCKNPTHDRKRGSCPQNSTAALSWADLEWAHAHGNWAAWSSFPTLMTHGPLSCPIGDMTISSIGHEYGLMGLTMDFDVVLSGWKKFIFPGLKPDLCQMPMGCTTKYCGSIFKECMTMLWWSIKHHLASEFS